MHLRTLIGQKHNGKRSTEIVYIDSARRQSTPVVAFANENEPQRGMTI